MSIEEFTMELELGDDGIKEYLVIGGVVFDFLMIIRIKDEEGCDMTDDERIYECAAQFIKEREEDDRNIGFKDCENGIAHVDGKGAEYDKGYAECYEIEQQQTHLTENQE